jgi:hypothetical protein
MNKLYKFAEVNGFNEISKFIGGRTLLKFDDTGDFLGFGSFTLGQNKKTHRFGYGSNEVDKFKCQLFDSKFVSNQFLLQKDITSLTPDFTKLNQFEEILNFEHLMQKCKSCMLGDAVPGIFGELSDLELTQLKFNSLLYKIVNGTCVSECDVKSDYENADFKTSQTDFWYSRLIEYLKQNH